jgi:hypothetical protein
MKIKIWGAIAHHKKLCGFTICCCFKVQLGIVIAFYQLHLLLEFDFSIHTLDKGHTIGNVFIFFGFFLQLGEFFQKMK